jgi:hypothetical protein
LKKIEIDLSNGTASNSDSQCINQQSEADVSSKSVAVDDLPKIEDLTPKQQETLLTIQENPDATQRELAEILDVSAPTVNNRVNAISNFEWEQRLPLAVAILESNDLDESEEIISDSKSIRHTQRQEDSEQDDMHTTTDRHEEVGVDHHETTDRTVDGDTNKDGSHSGKFIDPPGHKGEQLEKMIQRIELLDARIEAMNENDDGENICVEDPVLIHKVIHACMTSEKISKDEEIDIIKNLI